MVSLKKKSRQQELRFQGGKRNEMLEGLIQLSMFQLNNPNKYLEVNKNQQEMDFKPENMSGVMGSDFGLWGTGDAQDRKNAEKMERELIQKLEEEKKKLGEKKEKIRHRKIQERINEEHEKEVAHQLELVKAKAQKETDVLENARFEKQRLEADALRS
jgi:predicted nucleotidyltransferase